MSKVLNKDRGILENAEKIQCPRCKGFGQLAREDGSCSMCGGKAKVWMSNLGWYRKLHSPLNDSNRY